MGSGGGGAGGRVVIDLDRTAIYQAGLWTRLMKLCAPLFLKGLTQPSRKWFDLSGDAPEEKGG